MGVHFDIDYKILSELCKEDVILLDLAHRTKISFVTVFYRLKKYERLGMIKKIRDEKDGRRLYCKITNQGRTIYNNMTAIHQTLYKEVTYETNQ